MALGSARVGRLRVNDHATATNNFYIEPDNSGNMMLYQGNPGSATLLGPVSAGKVRSRVADLSGLAELAFAVPAWVNNITIDLKGISGVASNAVLIARAKNAVGTPVTSGYAGWCQAFGGSAVVGGASATSYAQLVYSSGSGLTWDGRVELTRVDNTKWATTSRMRTSTGGIHVSQGTTDFAITPSFFQLLYNDGTALPSGSALITLEA